MTVNTTNITSGPYTGNGVSDQFSYTFRIDQKSDLTIYETDTDGIETELMVDTDYTLSGVGDDAGGIATRTAGALPTGYSWYMRSSREATQLTDLDSQGAFFPDVHENAFDKLTFLIQQINEELSRTLQSPETESEFLNLTVPTPLPGYLMRWKDDLSGLENVEYPQNVLNVVSEDVSIVDGETLYTLATPGLVLGGARLEIAKVNASVDGTLLIEGGDKDYTRINDVRFSLNRSYPGGVIRVSNVIEGLAPTTEAPVVPLISDPDGPLELIAHRGFKLNAYENTLLACSYALNQGADSLEVDASISSDGVWYLFHDTSLDALTNGTGDFINSSSSYIDTLEYSKAVGTPNEGLKITKLDDFLNFVRAKGIKAYIEIKNIRAGLGDVNLFMAKLADYGLTNKVNVQSSVSDVITRARSLSATAELGIIVSTSDTSAAIATAQNAGANAILNAYSNYISVPDMAALFRGSDIEPISFTPNFAFEFDQLAAVGVRKIISDRSTIK